MLLCQDSFPKTIYDDEVRETVGFFFIPRLSLWKLNIGLCCNSKIS